MTSKQATFSEIDKVRVFPKDKLSVDDPKPFIRKKITKYKSHYCEICEISCNSKKIYDTHVMGKKHNKALEKLEASKFPCISCSLTLNDLDSWQQHFNSSEHKNTQSRYFTKDSDVPYVPRMFRYCDICKLDCEHNIIIDSHLTGAKHKRKIKLLKIEKLKENKDSSVYCEVCGISLEPELMLLHRLSRKHKKARLNDDNKSQPKSKRSMESCALCQKDFSLITEAIEHYNSTDHLENVKNNESIFWCEVCKIILPNESMMNTHLKGFRHYRILNREECLLEGTVKENLMLKRQKQKELRVQYEKEKIQQENID